MVYKQKGKQIIKFYIITLLYIVGATIFLTWGAISDDSVYFYTGIIIYGIFVLLPLIYHIRYLIYDLNSQVEINSDDIVLKKRNEPEVRLKTENISCIKYYKNTEYNNPVNISAIGIEKYYYLDIVTKDNKKYRFTCLIFPDIDKLPFPIVFEREILPLP